MQSGAVSQLITLRYPLPSLPSIVTFLPLSCGEGIKGRGANFPLYIIVYSYFSRLSPSLAERGLRGEVLNSLYILIVYSHLSRLSPFPSERGQGRGPNFHIYSQLLIFSLILTHLQYTHTPYTSISYSIYRHLINRIQTLFTPFSYPIHPIQTSHNWHTGISYTVYRHLINHIQTSRKPYTSTPYPHFATPYSVYRYLI